ncbi:hypothetical protein [Streptomyces jumonjinensis]|uniref:Uncharacterized protein n=1 Tax=Streptomyces jumonjinensis TaxID=1945 RepID=A0A646KLV3_STRJU|nr:hypothetical protein [Streptomyces jumonjinensis]MQT03017.1 hypothetical protein [Streptomyces jumonjinensis]
MIKKFMMNKNVPLVFIGLGGVNYTWLQMTEGLAPVWWILWGICATVTIALRVYTEYLLRKVRRCQRLLVRARPGTAAMSAETSPRKGAGRCPEQRGPAYPAHE